MYSSSGQASTYIIVKDTNLGRLNQINIVQVCLVAWTMNIEHETRGLNGEYSALAHSVETYSNL